MLHDPGKPNHPWGKLYVNKRQMWTKEVRAVLITDFDDFLDLVLQLLGVLGLLWEFLGLE